MYAHLFKLFAWLLIDTAHTSHAATTCCNSISSVDVLNNLVQGEVVLPQVGLQLLIDAIQFFVELVRVLKSQRRGSKGVPIG